MKEVGLSFDDLRNMTPDQYYFLVEGLKKWYKEEAKKYKKLFKVRRRG